MSCLLKPLDELREGWRLDGFFKRCLLKLDKKSLILLQKRLNLNHSNFGLLATKLIRFSLNDGKFEGLSFQLIPQIFQE